MGGWELDVCTAAVDEERAGRVRWQSFYRRDVPDYLQPLEPGLYPGRHHTFGVVLLRTTMELSRDCVASDAGGANHLAEGPAAKPAKVGDRWSE